MTDTMVEFLLDEVYGDEADDWVCTIWRFPGAEGPECTNEAVCMPVWARPCDCSRRGDLKWCVPHRDARMARETCHFICSRCRGYLGQLLGVVPLR